MSILKKIFTAIVGGTTEVGQAIVDNQAIRILDQEIRDVETYIRDAGQQLQQIAAKCELAGRRVASFDAEIEKYTNAARQHAESNRELALEAAQRVAELQQEKASEAEQYAAFKQSEDTLKADIQGAKASLKQLKQRVDKAKATEAVQKAQVAASSTFQGGSNKMRTALDSLERLEQRQQQRGAELNASKRLADEDSGASLDARLAQASKPASAEDALAAILKQSQP